MWHQRYYPTAFVDWSNQMALTLTCDTCGRSVRVADPKQEWWSMARCHGTELFQGSVGYATYCSPDCVAVQLYPSQQVEMRAAPIDAEAPIPYNPATIAPTPWTPEPEDGSPVPMGVITPEEAQRIAIAAETPPAPAAGYPARRRRRV